jgi:DNA replication protein DnaC
VLKEQARIEMGLPVDTPIEVIREAYIYREHERWGKESAERRKQAFTQDEANRRAEQIGRLWRESNVPSRHRDKAASFTGPGEWSAKRDIAQNIVDRGGIVALIGKRGAGKTQLAVDLIRGACFAVKSGCYLKAMDFFMSLRATFKPDSGSDEQHVLERLASYVLLTIDNVDRRGSTEWEDRLLAHLIDKRYDRCAATILIANLDEAAFSHHMGPDIVDRIREGGGLIVADWGSFRGV